MATPYCIYGKITFDTEQLDDFIIARSDGSPIYNLVVVADDAAMGVTHVVRGEDHLSNTPKQILLYEACGFAVPQFAHLPMILGPSGDRLSKRDGATATQEYRHEGYLADALLNYLARLGWSHGDQEIFTRQELIEAFTLEGVGKKGAIFDPQKLAWVNGVYMRHSSDGQLLTLLARDVDPEIRQRLSGWSEEQVVHAVALYKERVDTLKQLRDELLCLHDGPSTSAVGNDDTSEEAIACLHDVLDLLGEISSWDAQAITTVVKGEVKKAGIGFAQLAHLVRRALIGVAGGPGLSDLMLLVGRKATVSRIKKLLDTVERAPQASGDKGE